MFQQRTQSFVASQQQLAKADEAVVVAEMEKRCKRSPIENKFPASNAMSKTLTVTQVGEVMLRLNHAHPGDVVIFQEGTYNINLVITQPGLTLKAAPDAKVISPTVSFVCIESI
jgi:hypothetical protein